MCVFCVCVFVMIKWGRERGRMRVVCVGRSRPSGSRLCLCEWDGWMDV